MRGNQLAVWWAERLKNGVGIARLSDAALNVVTLEIDVSTTDKMRGGVEGHATAKALMS